MKTSYRAMISDRLDRPVGADAAAMAEHLSKRRGVLAVVFYGNLLRNPDAGGLLDLYVLTDRDAIYHGAGLSAFANRILPPNVYFETLPGGVQAKVAVLRLDAFAHRMRMTSWDTTLWARFAQPAALLYVRDDLIRERVLDALVTAHDTAARWAVLLSPQGSDARTAWQTLFAHTYGAELRVEGTGRATDITASAIDVYADVHRSIAVRDTPDDRTRAHSGWRKRRLAGKFLNAARLIKAAFTFRGGLAYAISKVERHSGQPVVLSAWEKRLPWLAAPFVFWRLLRERRLR